MSLNSLPLSPQESVPLAPFFFLMATNRPLPSELKFRENTGLKVVRFFRNLVKYCYKSQTYFNYEEKAGLYMYSRCIPHFHTPHPKGISVHHLVTRNSMSACRS